MMEDGDQLPTPRTIEQIAATDDLADYSDGKGYWAFVEVKVPAGVGK